MAGPHCLLIVDDDPEIGDLILQVADGLGFQTEYVGRSSEILGAVNLFEPSLILDLGQKLRLTVCAKGVETRETLEFLRLIGCCQAQGYLISKPLDGTGLARFLAGQAAKRATAITAASPGRREHDLEGVIP